MNIVFKMFVLITALKRDVCRGIIHAGFEGIEYGKGIVETQPVGHVAPTLLKGGNKAWVLRNPVWDAGVGLWELARVGGAEPEGEGKVIRVGWGGCWGRRWVGVLCPDRVKYGFG